MFLHSVLSVDLCFEFRTRNMTLLNVADCTVGLARIVDRSSCFSHPLPISDIEQDLTQCVCACEPCVNVSVNACMLACFPLRCGFRHLCDLF